MSTAQRPSIEITGKQNVNPSINRITEATAEDFQELGQILIDHANLIDANMRSGELADFYGFKATLPLFAASYPDAPDNSWGVIDPGNGNPQTIAKVVGGVWTATVNQAPIQRYNTKTDIVNPQENIWYVTTDSKLLHLWYNNQLNTFGKDGNNGLSAYQVAVAFGFEGTEAAWLESLKGAEGKSAYQSALDTGFVGTEAEWIESIEGVEGKSAYEVAVANGFVGTEAEWLLSLDGNPGDTGPEGPSAYEVAVANGFVGTEAEWLESLKGEQGPASGSITEQPLTDASVLSWDLTVNPLGYLLATSAVGNTRTLPNTVISSGQNSGNYQLFFKQDATGGRTILFEDSFTVFGNFDTEPNGVTVISLVTRGTDSVVVLTAEIPEVVDVPESLTGTEINLSQPLGDVYNEVTPSASLSYTTINPVINGFASCFINAASEPVVYETDGVTPATKIKGADFTASTLMEMVVESKDGSTVRYFFLEL